ncbi:MAG: S1 family peptidase, partial [Planctomycetota bacterium]
MRVVVLRILVSLLVCLSVVHADGMSVADLVNLKKAGFSEQEIQAEIAKSPPKLDQAGLAQLKSAGFSEAFLTRLRAASGGLAIDTVRSMHKAGKSVPEILAALPRSGDRPALTTPQALELSRAGVPAIVVRALRGGALSADELLRLAQGGSAASDLSALLDFVGKSGNATAEQAQALQGAGVPDSLIDRLRAASGGSISRTADGRSLYRHPADRFSLRYPAEWRLLLRPHKEKLLLEYVFTPDRAQTDPQKLSTGFSVVPVHLVPGSSFDIASLDDLVKLTVPSVLTEEPGLKLHGKPRSGRIAGADARIIELRGSGRGAKALRITSALVRREGVLCFVSSWAPVDQYEKHGRAFSRCAASLRFGKPHALPRRRPTTSQEFVRRYRNSVVQVRSPSASGTGFIVRKDGFVLTNQHVVYDQKKKTLIREFTLQFDASLKRRPLRAVLVAAKLKRLADAGRNLSAAGVDIALLKITDPGPFEPLPITPLSAVRLSDPVVTMGFPKSTLLGGFERLSMFVTRGVVVRFNKDAWGRTRGLFIDAKITHGSSGGPCVDLATGGVIGLNTWGFDIGKEATNDLVGYNGVVPIDAALQAWPDILRL